MLDLYKIKLENYQILGVEREDVFILCFGREM